MRFEATGAKMLLHLFEEAFLLKKQKFHLTIVRYLIIIKL